MLNNTEKLILGYMVDMGSLRGQERVNAAADDELARQLIADFSVQMQLILPRQIDSLQAQKTSIDSDLTNAQVLLDLLSD